MMGRFDKQAILTNIVDGKKYFIVSYNYTVSAGQGLVEEYVLADITNARNKVSVVGNAINDYVDEATLPPGWFPPAQHPSFENSDIMDALRYVTFDDTHIKLHKSLQKPQGCDHDWVTWTGLFGTTTDCSKCKAKQ